VVERSPKVGHQVRRRLGRLGLRAACAERGSVSDRRALSSKRNPRLLWRDGMLRIWRRAWWALLPGLLWLMEARTVHQTLHTVARGMASSLRAVQYERSAAARAEGDQRQQEAVAGKATMGKAHTQQMRALLHHSKSYDSGASGAQQQRWWRRGGTRAVVVSAADDSELWAESSEPAALGRALLGVQNVLRQPWLRAREEFRAGKQKRSTVGQPTAEAIDDQQTLADAQQHFLSVLRDVKEKLDEFHGVSVDDAAFGRRWSSCAVVRAHLPSLTLLAPHCESAESVVCPAPFCGALLIGGRAACRQVGNSGILLNASHGWDIDAHEAVFRMNRARIGDHGIDVGNRTTLQLMHAGLFRFCEEKEEVQCAPADESCKCVFNADEMAHSGRHEARADDCGTAADRPASVSTHTVSLDK
jgi:hypothetical protein